MTAAHSTAAPPLSAAMRSFEAQWRERSPARRDDPLTSLRESAMKRVLALGLPTARDESWRYTSLRHLAARGFVDAPPAAPAHAGPLVLPPWIGRAEVSCVVLVNGHPDLRSIQNKPINDIEISSLRDLSRTDPASVAARLPRTSDAEQGRWGLINTALFTDGLLLRVTAPTETPLVIVHLLTSEGANNIAYPRLIIDAAPGSRATIIEHYVDQGAAPPLCNSATHIAAARNAEVEHYRIFSTGPGAEHFDTLTIDQERDSRCRQFTIALGGGLIRTTLESRLNQPGASLRSYSMLVGHETRHVDCVNVVTHAAPSTESEQWARAIASGTSRVVFNSRVVVDPGSAHAQSQQSCRGLLLSPGAEIDTRPQLEIHADEVKCAHGATTGRLDPDMLFYLLSRGLPRATAQSLLVYAFLSDVLAQMSVPAARSALEDALIAQLPDSTTLNNFR
jgi:Fe-S cluster assembly protein SufD